MPSIKPELMYMHTTTVKFKSLKAAIDAATQLGEAQRVNARKLNDSISRQVRNIQPRRANIRTVNAVQTHMQPMPVDGSDQYMVSNQDQLPVDAISGQAGNASSRPGMPHRNLCFKCFKGGHTRPYCPLKDPDPNDPSSMEEYCKVVENNYFLLSEFDKQQLREKGISPFKPMCL